MITLTKFNRHFTLRKLEQFGDPRISQLEKLELPRGSVLHYLDMEVTNIGPLKTYMILNRMEKYAFVRHHYKLSSEGILGRPIPVKMEQKRDILSYHRQNPTVKRIRDDNLSTIIRDDKLLLVENYTPMVQLYRYADTILSWYERLHNIMQTMMETLLDDAANLERQNYVVIKMGNVLPAFSKFREAEKSRTNKKLEEFQKIEMLWLLELFCWLGERRSTGIFNKIEHHQARRINFIFTYDNAFVNFNLGELDGWSANSTDQDNKGIVNAEQMQRRLYKSVKKLLTEPVLVTAEDAIDPTGEDIKVEAISSADIDQTIDLSDIESDAKEEVAKFDEEEFIEDEDTIIRFEDEIPETTLVVEETIDHKDVILAETKKLAEAGRMSLKAKDFLEKAADNFVNLPDPYGSGTSYAEAMNVTAEDVEVKKKKYLNSITLLDGSWNEGISDQISKQYRENVLKKDILSSVASIQRMGAVVHSHRIEKEMTAAGAKEHHYIKIQPVDGDPVSVQFTVPVLDEDGCWTNNGVKYTMRRQRVDIPIRKVRPDRVALTTFYGKCFVSRSDKAVNDKPKWICDQIAARAVDFDDSTVTELHEGGTFVMTNVVPKDYSTLSKRIDSFKSGGYQFSFILDKTEELFSKHEKSYAICHKNNLIPIASNRKGLLGMADNNQIYKVEGTDDLVPVGTIEEFIGLDTSKAPKEMSVVSVMGKEISVGLVLSLYLGMTGMFNHIGLRYTRHPVSERINTSEYDMVIRLADAKFACTADTFEQKLVLNGLNRYLKLLPQYTESEVNREDIYLNLLMEDKLSARYLNELIDMRHAFVDDPHARILRRMKEPETFIGLLVRANELLVNDFSKSEINGDEMMFLTHQRIAGHVYAGLTRAMRNYRNSPPGSRRLELTNAMVWGEIQDDPSVLQAQEANPIQSIKEKDVTTLGGTGGRSKITMVKSTRAYTESDVGVMSGDTVDNSDAGVTTFLSANPRLETVDGMTKPTDSPIKDSIDAGVGTMMSFFTGLAPDSLVDDDKRWNFVNIQMGSAQACEEGICTPYRSGLEKLVAHRASNMHARTAKAEGVVVSVSEDSVTVRYKDKSEEEFPLGRWFGNHEGSTYPHDMATTFKKGMKVSEGSVVTYNSSHFEPDIIDADQVNWKNGVLATVAFIEGEPTFEDSNEMDQTLANKLRSETTKVKEVTLRFDQIMLDMLKAGQHVDPETILCTFADDVSGGTSDFSDEAAETLRSITSHSPKADVDGTIDKIEVFYHGEVEDMTESVAKIVQTSDRLRRRAAKASNGKLADNGSVDSSFRINGVPLAYNEVAIRFYITHMNPMVGGDKCVFANQMKTTVQSIMVGENRAKDGTVVNMYSGRVGVEGRIVGSVYNIGTTNPICIEMGKRGLRILNGEKVIPYS